MPAGFEISGIDEVIDGPKLGQPVLNRCAGQRDAMPCREASHGGGLFGVGILDVLGLVVPIVSHFMSLNIS